MSGRRDSGGAHEALPLHEFQGQAFGSPAAAVSDSGSSSGDEELDPLELEAPGGSGRAKANGAGAAAARRRRGSAGGGAGGGVLHVVEVSWKNGIICCLLLFCVLLLGMVIGESSNGVACVPGRCGIPLDGSAGSSAEHAHGGGGMSMGGHGHGHEEEEHGHGHGHDEGEEEHGHGHDQSEEEHGHGEGSAPTPPPTPPPTPAPTPEPSPAPTAKPAKMTPAKLAAGRAAAQNVRALLEKYYGGHSELLGLGWHIPPSDAGANQDKLVDTFARALVDDKQSKFMIGTIGSSVAAGHDNCNYDSYEKQTERLFKPVWEAMGMQFEHQNAGEGGGCGDSHDNQIFCVKQNVSPHVDIVHYSWTYFEGRDGAPVQHEYLVRWAAMMERQPPVHFFDVGGTFDEAGKRTDCYGVQAALFKQYAYLGANAFCLEAALYAGRQYPGKVWGHVGDGYHNTTRYGEVEPNSERRDSLGVLFRNWHPGPLGFQTSADNFVYHYAGYLLKAMEAVEKSWAAGEDPRKKWTIKREPMLKSELPKPLTPGVDPRYAVVDDPPECLNNELPTYGQHGVSVAAPDDELNPYRGQVQAWKLWHDEPPDLIPRFEQKFYEATPEFCRHLDHCGGLQSGDGPDAGWLVLKLPKMSVGLIVMCACCGKDVAKKQIKENDALEVYLDGKLLDHARWDYWPNNKCVRIAQEFPSNMNDGTGHIYLAVRIKPDAVAPTPVTISHVFTL